MKTKLYTKSIGLLVLLFVFFAGNVLAQIVKQSNISNTDLANTSIISGKVYFDANNNGVFDANEFGIPNQTVSIGIGKYLAITNEDGDYQLLVAPGSYQIETNNSSFQKITTTYQNAILNAGELDSDNNIGIYSDVSISDLQIKAIAVNQPQPGKQHTIELICTNVGSAMQDGEISFIKDRNFIFIDAKPAPTEIKGDTMIWRFASLKPFSKKRIEIHLSLPETISLGKSMSSIAKITGNNNDIFAANNNDTVQQFVAAATLSNFKSVDPSGVVKTYSSVPSNVSLVYTIYFQNTNAFLSNDIVIIDTLTSKLSPGTFTFVGSSHPCNIQFAVNVLTFEFLNINMPDSATNFNGSMGWVQFIINTANNMDLNDSVKNSADIYFDYNTPIRTSEARVDFVNVSAIDEYNPNKLVQVYPNPFDDRFEVQFEKPCLDCKFELLDVTGKIIRNQLLSDETKYSFDRNNLAAGFYVYKITQQNKIIEVGKLIAQ